VQTLSQMQDPENAPWLLGIVRDGSEPIELRLQALQAASQSGVEPKELAKLYSPKADLQIRTTLISLYAQMADPAVFDKLAEAAKSDPDQGLRKTAFYYVTHSNDPRAAKILQEIVEER
jgi:hypothetical protein